MLASDLNNPEFVNPLNPDSLLHIEFYWNEPVDKWKSDTEGKIIRGPKIPFIRIMKPGDNTSILETAVREDHKARWPDKWLYWQMKEGLVAGSADIPGWKIDDWKDIDEDQKRELKFLRFSVVEQVAGASDSQVQRMGMGGLGLREKAKQALRAKMGSETKDAMLKKDQEIAELKSGMARLEALINEKLTEKLTAAPEPASEVSSASVSPVAASKRKGRPKGSKNKPKEVS